MATYKPRIVKTPEGNEQQFGANVVHVGPGLIALGELKPEAGKALKYGTPIHSVLLHCSKGDLSVELNDQGNTSELWTIAHVGLSPTNLCVVFCAGFGPKSGRVSLAPEIEIFKGKDPKPKKLGAVRVAMKPTPAQLKRITSMLRAAAPDKLVVATKSRAV
jgi:hypothetical protein